MLARKIYWCFEAQPLVKKPKQDLEAKLEEAAAEVEHLRKLLGEHIDLLDDTESEIEDFVSWTRKTPSAIPSYAIGGLKALVGAR